MSELDLEALKRFPRREYALPPDFVVRFSVSVDAPTWDAILAALERAERVEAAARAVAEAPDLVAGDDVIHALRAALTVAPAEPREPDDHIIEFRDNGWTIMHPLSCRPNLFECAVNRAAEADLEGPPERLGRYVCWEANGMFFHNANPVAAAPAEMREEGE